MTFNTYWSAALLIRCQEARRNAPPGYLFGRCRILAQKPDFNLFGLTIFLSSVYKTLNELDDTDPESNASQKFLSLLDTEILFQETRRDLNDDPDTHTPRLLQSSLTNAVHLRWQRNAVHQEPPYRKSSVPAS